MSALIRNCDYCKGRKRANFFILCQVCVTTLKPEVRITRKCLAQVRARVAVADLAFTTSKFTAVSLSIIYCHFVPFDVTARLAALYSMLLKDPKITSEYILTNCYL